MKRFHFATIHLVMIGLILFGIATIFVRVLKSESALIFALFIIMVVVVALLHYQKTTYESLEIEQLDELNQDVEDSLKTLLGKMPVGVITFDENDHIEWFNPYAKLVLSDENGNFNPNQGITRAQCAAVVCRLLDAEADAQSMTTTAFMDVPTSHWANGYIAWAYDHGIINGYGNGEFGPSDTVTYEQAIKMLIGGIGYDDAAIDAGGYPYGYISIADNCGFLHGVEDTFGDVITRANIAVIIANIVSI